MRRIIKIHGTSGAGKTTLVRTLMKECSLIEPVLHIKKPKKHEAYLCTHPSISREIVVLGSYQVGCGGLDTVDSNEQIDLLDYYGREHEESHIVYESLFTSAFYGRIGKLSERFGDSHIFAFLTTPIDECVERVKARRLARGDKRPLNPANTVDKAKAVEKLRLKLISTYKRPTVDITTYEDFLSLFEGELNCL